MTIDSAEAAELERLRRRLAEAEQTIEAFTSAKKDAAIASPAPAPPLPLQQAQEELRRSERLFRAVFDGVDDGILLLDSDGVFLDANPAACSLFGRPESEIVGHRPADFAATGYDVASEQRNVVDGRRRGLLRVALPDGEERELAYHVTCDILPGVHMSTLRDVGLLNQTRSELVASEKKYRQIVDTAREGIWVIDEQARTTFANRALERMLGYLPGEMLGRSLFDFVDPKQRELTAQGLERRRLGIAERQDQKYTHKDGSAVWVIMEASPLTDDAGNYVGGLAMVTDVTDRKRAEEALRASEERYRLLFDNNPLAIWLTDVSSLRFVAVNQAALVLFGYEREEFLALDVTQLLSSSEAEQLRGDIAASRVQGVQSANRRPVKKNGEVVEVAVTSQTFVIESRDVALVIARDMTERNRLESQLAQSRKMEAIGILAGGVAHDFNNLLSIMVTYTTFALDALEEGGPVRADLEQVATAAARAVSLTRQLLAFSRQQILEPVVIDLNATIATIEPMLRRLVGEDIEISFVPETSLGRVSADPGQVEQVILNLVVNARDAMPAGGELTIETANVYVAKGANATGGGPKPGPHVMLAVRDTGSGMDAATRERVFEPFFTTKEVGKGTGLGLPTVLGIVQQSGGHVELLSEPGKGTRFEVYLPRVDGPLSPLLGAAKETAIVGGHETVLVVEDDEQVRSLTRSILRRNGYQVLSASNAGEALLISEQHEGGIHLLLTDVVMPRISGRQLAERLAATRPEMKVLFMTGYTDDAVVRQGVFDADLALYQKPITPEALPRRVRAVLDSPRVRLRPEAG